MTTSLPMRIAGRRTVEAANTGMPEAIAQGLARVARLEAARARLEADGIDEVDALEFAAWAASVPGPLAIPRTR